MRPLPRALVFPLLLPVALVWQVSAWALLPVFHWRLDPTLVLVMAAGLLMGPRYGALFGMAAGACLDLLLGAGLLYGISKAIAGWVAGLIQPNIYQLDTLSLMLIGLVTTLVEGLGIALYLLVKGHPAVWDHYAALALPLGVAHAFLIAIAYPVLHRFPVPEARE